MSYDTDNLQFPVELPGGVMTEQADFWAMFGPARTVSLDDTTANPMSMDTGAASPNLGSKDKDDEPAPSEEPAPSQEPGDGSGSVTVTSDDGATTLTFNSDGTYRFFFEQYSVEDMGTYTYEGGALTVTNSNGLEMTAGGDPMKLHYVTAVSDQLTGDFTISGAELDTQQGSGTSQAAEIVTVTSDDGATTLTFNSDGTYRFFFEQYSVEDMGTYTYEGGALTVTNANGLEMTAEGDRMKLHYVTAVSDQLTGDFTINAADLGA